MTPKNQSINPTGKGLPSNLHVEKILLDHQSINPTGRDLPSLHVKKFC
jgi:hypothetical protein